MSAIRPDDAAVTNAMGFQPQKVEWLWPKRVPWGKVTVLDGDPEVGKSTFTINLAARVSTASPMPDGSRSDRLWGHSVLIINGEDGAADTMVPRLLAAHADLARVNFLNGVWKLTADGEDLVEQSLSLPSDIGSLERAIEAYSADFIVIDPFTAFLDDHINAYRDHDVRRALMPLARLADRTGAAILAVRHLNKSEGAKALYRGGGSIAIVGAARAGLLIALDPEDENRRVLAVTKSNLARKPTALAFHLSPDELHDCAAITWDGPCKFSANDLVAAPARTDPDLTAAVADAMEFLRAVLSDSDLPVQTIRKEAKACEAPGFTILRKAKVRLGITHYQKGRPGDKDRHWKWHLPPENAKPQVEPTVATSSNGKVPGQPTLATFFPQSPRPE